MELAQVNVARLRAPLGSPAMREFVTPLPRVNRLAEQSPGFVCRLRSDDQHGVSAATDDGQLGFVNLSVWTSYEQLHAYLPQHARRFRAPTLTVVRPHPAASTALWWVQPGERGRATARRGAADAKQTSQVTARRFRSASRHPPEDHMPAHDRGLAHDLSRLVRRRRMLGLIAGAGLTSLVVVPPGRARAPARQLAAVSGSVSTERCRQPRRTGELTLAAI